MEQTARGRVLNSTYGRMNQSFAAGEDAEIPGVNVRMPLSMLVKQAEMLDRNCPVVLNIENADRDRPSALLVGFIETKHDADLKHWFRFSNSNALYANYGCITQPGTNDPGMEGSMI